MFWQQFMKLTLRSSLYCLGAGAAYALASSGIKQTVSQSAGKSRNAAEAPCLCFGVIADIQYCDCDDATNFAGTEVRCYRSGLEQTGQAVRVWNSLPDLNFVAQLGDLIDGQNNGKYGAGLQFEEPQSAVAFDRVVSSLSACHAPMLHAIGNHELYNFKLSELIERLQRPAQGWRVAGDDGYCCFSVQPCKGWTVIMLNPYEVSLMQEKCHPGYEEAAHLLNTYNPNGVVENAQGVNFFSGLSGRKLRYVPFNGAVGERQRKWLQEEVRKAVDRDDRMIVLTHLPLDARAASFGTMCWDGEEVMKILHEDGFGRVVAVFAGHMHKGGYCVDGEGVHHVTLQSPLTHSECFGYVDVLSDRLELHGHGGLVSQTMPFPPLQRVPSTRALSARST